MDTGALSRTQSGSRSASSKKSSNLRIRSKSLSAKDVPLKALKTKWGEILEEEGITTHVSLTRAVPNSKPSPRLETAQEPGLNIVFQENELPRELQAEGQIIEREVFRSICIFFTSYSSITILRFVDCKLKAEAISVLGNVLSNCGQVKELYLDLNPVSGEDYSPLLDNNTTLEVLSLKGCAISERGAKLLSDKLHHRNLNLRVLNLNTNLIDDSGANALAMSLKWNSKLFFLSLAGNNIGTNGAKCFMDILKEFTLGSDDLERRRVILQEKANLILSIVNERKKDFLAALAPMPALPSGDFSVSSRSLILKIKKKSDTKIKTGMGNTSSSRLTSKGDKRMAAQSISTKDSATNKIMDKSNDRSPNKSKDASTKQQHPSGRQTSTSVTGLNNEGTEQKLKSDFESDLDNIHISDDDRISEFTLFEVELREDWDHADNMKRYQETMVSKLIEEVGRELNSDPTYHNDIMSNVYKNEKTGQLCSRGNRTLTHLNLAYNNISKEIVDVIMETIWYQDKFNVDGMPKYGLKMLLLEGNPVPPQFLEDLLILFRPIAFESENTFGIE